MGVGLLFMFDLGSEFESRIRVVVGVGIRVGDRVRFRAIVKIIYFLWL